MRLRDILNESDASEEAKKKGLVGKGWGRWYNKQGDLVAKTVDGKLEYVQKKEPTNVGVDEPQIDKTVSFAIRVHGDQKYGDKPYEYHLKQVFDNAVKFGGSLAARQAAILHDTLEDTAVTKPELEAQFGPKVAHLVDLLTNQPSKENTYRRIRTDPEAVFVKLCDRLANVSEGQKNGKYRKEHSLFKSILYRRGEYDTLWHAIDAALGVH